MESHLVFVYGTLRRTGVRDILKLFPDSRFIATAMLRGRLYDLGSYPGLLLDNEGLVVRGEIYEVSDHVLKQLDAIEGCSHKETESSLYHRRQVTISTDSGDGKDCWVYECNPNIYACRKIIESGDWIDYLKHRDISPQNALADENPVH